jgi:hypothetical protein
VLLQLEKRQNIAARRFPVKRFVVRDVMTPLKMARVFCPFQGTIRPTLSFSQGRRQLLGGLSYLL